MQIGDKCENVLKEMSWNGAYLVIGLEDQYVENQNNNATHISSVEIHVGVVYMHTLYLWPCHIMLHIYYAHVVSQSFYTSQIGDYPFHQNFCFFLF